MRAGAIIAAVAVCTGPAAAEDVVFRCAFDWVCDPNTRCDHAAKDIRFRVDVAAGTVSRLGGNNLSDFELLLGDRAITVLERPVSGGAVTTTIMLADGTAVHSENLVTGRELTPMQYVGNCFAS